MQTSFARQNAENPDEGRSPSGRGVRAGQTGVSFARSRSTTFKSRGNPLTAGSDRGLIEALASSKVFQDYERAFTEATGLPVALRPVETWQLPHHGKRNESPFCAVVSEKSRACASCLQVQEKLSEAAAEEAQTFPEPSPDNLEDEVYAP